MSCSTRSTRLPNSLKLFLIPLTSDVTDSRDFVTAVTFSLRDLIVAARSPKALVRELLISETALATSSLTSATDFSTTVSTSTAAFATEDSALASSDLARASSSTAGASSATAGVSTASATIAVASATTSAACASGATSAFSTTVSETVSVDSVIRFTSLVILIVLMPLALSTKNFISFSVSLSFFSIKPMFCIALPFTGLVAESESDTMTIPFSESQNTFSISVFDRYPSTTFCPLIFSIETMFAN